MKIRYGFVSNSSSQSFLLDFKEYPSVADVARTLLTGIKGSRSVSDEYLDSCLKKLQSALNKGLDPNTPLTFPTTEFDTFIVRRSRGYEVNTDLDSSTAFSDVNNEDVEDVEEYAMIAVTFLYIDDGVFAQVLPGDSFLDFAQEECPTHKRENLILAGDAIGCPDCYKDKIAAQGLDPFIESQRWFAAPRKIIEGDTTTYPLVARIQLAQLPYLPPDIAQQLAQDGHYLVRLNLARNANVPPAIIERLKNDSDPHVQAAAAQQKSSDTEWNRAGWAKSESTLPPVLKFLARDPDDNVRELVAHNIKTPPEVRKELKEEFGDDDNDNGDDEDLKEDEEDEAGDGDEDGEEDN